MTALERLWPGLLLCALALPAAAAEPSSDIEPRVEACAACHGHQGRSAEEGYAPSIAGKPARYLYEQLRNFRDGRRQNLVMQPMLAFLADDYLQEIAAYYAAQDPALRVAQRGAGEQVLATGRALVEHGDATRRLPACQECHGANLLGHEPAIPGLLALSPDYLAAQLGAWRTGVRNAKTPDCMAQVASLLSPDEIAAVTAWIASRPVPEAHRPSADTPPELPLRCGAAP
ncbi:MAG TPA: c-type cytochrome [Gammaproteobacteria bacterium]|jgi:cytochrome c553|nr:c-type cytochrome [Gammaproteobacteria bacterium]